MLCSGGKNFWGFRTYIGDSAPIYRRGIRDSNIGENLWSRAILRFQAGTALEGSKIILDLGSVPKISWKQTKFFTLPGAITPQALF